jgi:hypothetical protein
MSYLVLHVSDTAQSADGQQFTVADVQALFDQLPESMCVEWSCNHSVNQNDLPITQELPKTGMMTCMVPADTSWMDGFDVLSRQEQEIVSIYEFQSIEGKGVVRYHLKPKGIFLMDKGLKRVVFEIVYQDIGNEYARGILRHKALVAECTMPFVENPEQRVDAGVTVTFKASDNYEQDSQMTFVTNRPFTLGELAVVLGPRLHGFYDDDVYYNQAVVHGLLKPITSLDHLTIDVGNGSLSVE